MDRISIKKATGVVEIHKETHWLVQLTYANMSRGKGNSWRGGECTALGVKSQKDQEFKGYRRSKPVGLHGTLS